LSDDDVLVKEKVRLADKFNEYFTSIGEELAAGLDDISDSGVVHEVQRLKELLTRLMWAKLLDTIKCLYGR
jgi:hypothetical protein